MKLNFVSLATSIALAVAAAACSVPPIDFTGFDGGGPNPDAGDASGPPMLVVSVTELTVDEAAQATFTVQLSAPPSAAVLISIDSGDANRVGVTPSSVSLDATNWNQPRTVTVSGREDADTEDEAVTVSVSSSVGNADVDVTVEDDDQLGFVVTPPSGLQVTEGETSSITVHLTAQPSGPVAVTVASSDPAVMTASPTTLNFGTGTWDLDQTVVLSGVEDVDIVGGTANVMFTGAGVDPANVAVEIIDDDPLGIAPSTGNLGTVAEGTTTTFTVELTQQPPGNVTVNVGTSNALVLTAGPATLTFTNANWDTGQTVTVTLPQDADTTDATANVTLTSTGLTPRTVSATVDDDDIQVIQVLPTGVTMLEGQNRTVDVRLAFQPAADITLGVTSLNPALATAAPASLTFTAANYDQTQAITIAAPQDSDATSGTTSVRIESLAAGLTKDVSVGVTDDDQLLIETSATTVTLGEAGMATFNVRLTAMPVGNVMVNAASGDATAATVGPAMLTFTPANYNTFQPVTVSGVADLDLVNETVTVTLTSASAPNATVSATVTDDDMQIVQVSSPTVTVNDVGSGTVGVSLGFMPAASTTVTVMSADTSAATVAPASLIFTPANYATPQNITVSGVDDLDALEDATTINLTAPSATAASVAVTIVDTDALGLETSVASTTITEGMTGTVGVRLTAQPAGNVVVMVMSSDATAATAMPAMLTFTTANFGTFQNVTLTGVDDADAVDDSVTLTVSAATFTSRTVNVTVDDNDTQLIVASTGTLTVGEAGNGTFTVHLSAQPVADVTVAVASTNTNKATAAPANLTFTSANYAANQTVTVSGVADLDLANDSATINLSSAGLTTVPVATTVTDDDMQVVLANPAGPLTINEGGGPTTVGFSLGFIPAGTVAVTVTAATGVGVNLGSLTFTPANYATLQNVQVTATDDANAADINSMVTASASGATSAVVMFTVRDDDPLDLEVSTTSLTVVEGSTNTFNVRLTAQPAASTVVMVGSSDTSAATAAPSSLTFTTANWNVFQPVTVTGVQDVDVAPEAATITVSSTGFNSKTVGVTVTEDDVLTIQVSASGITVAEGSTGTVGVTLSHMPSGNVTVSVASGDTTAVSVSPAAPAVLTFTSANYATAQNVTATAINDADVANEVVTVTLSSASAANKTFTVSTTDDDIILTDVNPQMNANLVSGTTVTFTGQGFDASTTASLNGTALGTPQVVNSTTLTGHTPAWAIPQSRFGDARVVKGASSSIIPRAHYFGGWSQATSGLSGGDVRAIATFGSATVYAGADGGFYRSTDSGATWQYASVGLPANTTVWAVAVNPINPQQLWVGTDSGVYATTNGGNTWTLSFGAGEVIKCVAVSNNGNFLVACSQSGGRVYRSIDNGATWTVTLTAASPNAAVFATGQTIWVASGAGVHITTDQGTTWNLFNSGLPANPTGVSLAISGTTGWVGTFSGVYKTTNQGVQWTFSGSGMGMPTCNGLVFFGAAAPGLYCATSSGSMYRSTDGASSWTSVNTGLPPTSPTPGIRTVGVSADGSSVYAAPAFWGIYRSGNQGQSWASSTAGISGYNVTDIAPHPTTTGTVFVAPEGMGVWKSTNNGASWTSSSTGIPTTSSWQVVDIAYTQSNPAIMWISMNGQGVKKSTDSGATWANTGLSGLPIDEVAAIDATTAYAVGTGGVRKTTDGGTTWALANTGLTALNVRSITAQGGADLYLIETTTGIWHSVNNGASWTLQNTSLLSANLNTIWNDDNSDTLFAQGLSATYRSSDGGTTWQQIATSTQCFAIDPLYNSIVYFCGTASSGVRRTVNGGTNIWTTSDQLIINPDPTVIGVDAVQATTVYAGMRDRGMFRLAPN